MPTFAEQIAQRVGQRLRSDVTLLDTLTGDQIEAIADHVQGVLRGVVEAAPPAEDRVRVLRLYSFEGPRSVVEAQLQHSLQDGTNEREGWSGGTRHGAYLTIHVATLGRFPEILPARPGDDILVVGGDRIYFSPKDLNETASAQIYREARAKQATHILLPIADRERNRLMYSMAGWEQSFGKQLQQPVPPPVDGSVEVAGPAPTVFADDHDQRQYPNGPTPVEGPANDITDPRD